MLNKKFVSLLAAVFVTTFSAAAIAQEAGGPRLTLVDPLKDFGTVAKGAMLEWDFTIKNSGDQPLEILNVQPTCGCTVAEFDRTIAPGATGKIRAVVDTTQFSGPISKGINITSTDPNQPAAQLTMRAIVKPYVDAHPAGFMRFMLLEGDVTGQSIVLYSEEEKPFEIVGVEAPSDNIKVDFARIENPEERVPNGRAGQNQYRVNVTVAATGGKMGPLAEKVKIITNSEHQPEYLLSLSGIIRPAYIVNPGMLNFGEVSGSDSSTIRTISVKTNKLMNPEQFQITKVESSNGAVAVESKPTDKPGTYELTVKLNQGAKAGEITGDIKIHTTDPNRPVYTLPLAGVIKG